MLVEIEKLGNLNIPSKASEFMASHAVYPAPICLGNGIIRIFFCSRDQQNRGQVFWCDVLAEKPTEIISLCADPVLKTGTAGAFDEDGISIGNVIQDQNGDLLLYYMGWNRGVTVPFRNAIGQAKMEIGSTNFQRSYPGPVIDRSIFDPYTISYPFVFREDGQWKMIYGSQRGDTYAPMRHVLTQAVSEDGFCWDPSPEIVVDLEDPEIGLSRPWRIKRGADQMYLLFSAADEDGYKIVLAKKNPAGKWVRIHNNLIPTSEHGWDSQETSYASCIESNGHSLIFYNGNDHGKTGFGVCKVHWQ